MTRAKYAQGFGMSKASVMRVANVVSSHSDTATEVGSFLIPLEMFIEAAYFSEEFSANGKRTLK